MFDENDPGDRLYIIERGEVEFFKKQGEDDELLLSTYGPGQMFGELALVYGTPRSAGARTKKSADDESPVILWALERDIFRQARPGS